MLWWCAKASLRANNDVVDRDVNELDEEANKAHNREADGRGKSNLFEFWYYIWIHVGTNQTPHTTLPEIPALPHDNSPTRAEIVAGTQGKKWNEKSEKK